MLKHTGEMAATRKGISYRTELFADTLILLGHALPCNIR
jgi:hypothetical protein